MSLIASRPRRPYFCKRPPKRFCLMPDCHSPRIAVFCLPRRASKKRNFYVPLLPLARYGLPLLIEADFKTSAMISRHFALQHRARIGRGDEALALPRHSRRPLMASSAPPREDFSGRRRVATQCHIADFASVSDASDELPMRRAPADARLQLCQFHALRACHSACRITYIAMRRHGEMRFQHFTRCRPHRPRSAFSLGRHEIDACV